LGNVSGDSGYLSLMVQDNNSKSHVIVMADVTGASGEQMWILGNILR
jgi:hypothetical protein